MDITHFHSNHSNWTTQRWAGAGSSKRFSAIFPFEVEATSLSTSWRMFHKILCGLNVYSFMFLFFFRANTSTISFDVYLTIPKISFVGKYYLRIKILLLEIAGKGNMTGIFGELFHLQIFSVSNCRCNNPPCDHILVVFVSCRQLCSCPSATHSSNS